MTTQRPLALVTGGSSGIGFELAKQFAQNGFDVAISGSSDKVFSAADALRGLGVEDLTKSKAVGCLETVDLKCTAS